MSRSGRSCRSGRPARRGVDSVDQERRRSGESMATGPLVGVAVAAQDIPLHCTLQRLPTRRRRSVRLAASTNSRWTAATLPRQNTSCSRTRSVPSNRPGGHWSPARASLTRQTVRSGTANPRQPAVRAPSIADPHHPEPSATGPPPPGEAARRAQQRLCPARPRPSSSVTARPAERWFDDQTNLRILH